MEDKNTSPKDTNEKEVYQRPHIYDGDYFEVISRDRDMLSVLCKMCGTKLRASVSSSSNLLKHVQRRHPEKLEKLKREKKIKARALRSGNLTRDSSSREVKTLNKIFAPKLDTDCIIPDASSYDDQFEYDLENDKVETRSIELIPCDDDNTSGISPIGQTNTGRELVEYQKELMRVDYEQKQQFRKEKHQLEMSILKTELAHKTLEHQKRMEMLEKQKKAN